MEKEPSPGRVLPWMPAARDDVQPEDRPAVPQSPEHTGAEARFYKDHMLRRTPMVVVTLDGRKNVGWIEWYDRDVLKLHSMTEPNLFLSKSDIKCIYRHEDDPDFEGPIPTPPPITRPWTRRRGRRS